MSDNKPKEIPTNLTHKPIYAINDYEKIDGNYKTNTDVVGVSIGKAQWDENNFVPAVKVWRYKNRWCIHQGYDAGRSTRPVLYGITGYMAF